jgi:hypothetical protein
MTGRNERLGDYLSGASVLAGLCVRGDAFFGDVVRPTCETANKSAFSYKKADAVEATA